MRLLHCCLLLTALLTLASCGARTTDAPSDGSFPAIGDLDALSRSVSDITTVNGVDAIATSGPPSAQPHPTVAEWLVLDGDQASGVAAWGIWRMTIAPGETPQFIDVNLPQNGLKRYWIGYADFDAQQWQFLDTAGNALGKAGSSVTIQPADPGVLLSPANNMYVAILVLPTQKINVGYFEANYSPVVGPDPIFDDFEGNDWVTEDGHPGNGCYMLSGPGMYHASLHETPQEMNDPLENVDEFDFYCIDVPAGQELTVTLRHDALNFFTPGDGGYNDLDIWFYNDSASDWANDMVEANSSFTVGYAFEQIHVTGLSGIYKLGIIPDLDDGGYEENALYDLSVFYSNETHSVNGKVTQTDLQPVRFTVFLEPGNFNAPTSYDSGDEGKFSIPGVPNGTYTLKVQGTALDNQTGHVYATTLPVVVNNADENNVNITIESFNP